MLGFLSSLNNPPLQSLTIHEKLETLISCIKTLTLAPPLLFNVTTMCGLSPYGSSIARCFFNHIKNLKKLF